MKIVDSADWRDQLSYEAPYRVDEVIPGEPARCAGCPANAESFDRAKLWAVKHRHPTNHGGYVRFYCADHLPARPAPPVAPTAKPSTRRSAPRATTRASSTQRTTPANRTDVVRAMCPDCFVEVSAAGECGVCGIRI